jgi:hypothetical protein
MEMSCLTGFSEDIQGTVDDVDISRWTVKSLSYHRICLTYIVAPNPVNLRFHSDG